ncbi:hypothetical protein ACROYT_G007391, partial [Oculina patagonica]
ADKLGTNYSYPLSRAFSVMKSHTCVPVVAVLVVILVMAVQEVQLISPLGRRFGRSLNKKYSPGRPLRPQVQYYRQQTFPQNEDENGEGQHFYEWGFDED